MTNELDMLEHAYAEALAKNEKLEHAYAEATATNEKLERVCFERLKEKKELEKENNDLEKEIKELAEETKEIEKGNKELAEKLAERRKQLAETYRTLRALQAANRGKEKEHPVVKQTGLDRPNKRLVSSTLAPRFDEMAVHIARTSKSKKNGEGVRRNWTSARLKIREEMGVDIPENCKVVQHYFRGKGKAVLDAADANVKLQREEQERIIKHQKKE